MIFFCHEEAILKARRMPESLIIDATYKSNAHKLSSINIADASNVMSPNLGFLTAFEIVGAWVNGEQTYSYEWVVSCLKERIWPASLDQQISLPSVIVTDNDKALGSAMVSVFPCSLSILCYVHLQRNFECNLMQEVIEIEKEKRELIKLDIQKTALTAETEQQMKEAVKEFKSYFLQDGIFEIQQKLARHHATMDHERATRFHETYIIDATYSINSLKMPLLCVYGVSNLGGLTLKASPVAFAWIANEREETYSWFLKTLDNVFGGVPKETILITDKCTALMNQLDCIFPLNKKVLCRWHLLNNLDKNCTASLFKNNSSTKVEFKDCVKNIMNKPSFAEFLKNGSRIRDILLNKGLFVNEEERIKFKNYYEIEWKLHLEKWAAIYTSKLQHMGCTTTQRAESDHSALKIGMLAVQPLQMSFEEINDYIEKLERDFNDLQQKEKSKQPRWIAYTNEFFANQLTQKSLYETCSNSSTKH
ncbi:hypothetical protein RMATCC62417_10101 [Rhizopus microsporus]|nr:hypothetical protein RMATCC62417_10101 [Rhizopus microsporus]